MAKRKAPKVKSEKPAHKEPPSYHVYRVAYLVNGSESAVHVLGTTPAQAAAHLKSYNEPAEITGVSEVVQHVKVPSGISASPKPKLIKAAKPPKPARKPRKEPSKKAKQAAAKKLDLQDSKADNGE